jgi:hypothetical protein
MMAMPFCRQQSNKVQPGSFLPKHANPRVPDGAAAIRVKIHSPRYRTWPRGIGIGLHARVIGIAGSKWQDTPQELMAQVFAVATEIVVQQGTSTTTSVYADNFTSGQ